MAEKIPIIAQFVHKFGPMFILAENEL